ncbi:hypothetical protein D9M68_536660 [compost metagenome]
MTLLKTNFIRMKKLFILGVCLLTSISAFAQLIPGPRLAAMGLRQPAIQDIWGVAGNPAGLLPLPAPTIQISQQFFFSTLLRQQAIAFVLPLNRSGLGLYLQRYGIPEYIEFKGGISLSRSFGEKLAIGLRANFQQLKATGYGTLFTLSVDGGFFYRLGEVMYIGLYTDQAISTAPSSSVKLPEKNREIHMGISYSAYEKMFLTGYITLLNAIAVQTGIGMEYPIFKGFYIRCGIHMQPLSLHSGIGMKWSNFTIDLTFIYRHYIGHSSLFALGYVF